MNALIEVFKCFQNSIKAKEKQILEKEKSINRLRIYRRKRIKQVRSQKLKVEEHVKTCGKAQFKICDALHNLVPFVQFKKREKHPWRSASVTYSLFFRDMDLTDSLKS